MITVTDNLNGFTDTIRAVFPESTTQICVVHQIRSSCRYVVWKDMKAFTADMVGDLYWYIAQETNSEPVYQDPSSPYSSPILNYATSKGNVRDFLRRHINTSDLQWYDPQLVHNSLNYFAQPVLVMGEEVDGGNGHAFIIDSYVYTALNSPTRQAVLQYDIYYHLNLGWADYNNGWYLLNKQAHILVETHLGTWNTFDLSVLTNLCSK